MKPAKLIALVLICMCSNLFAQEIIKNNQVTSADPWGEYQYLNDQIKRAQAATVRITMSTAVMISPTHAITAAHSPLDENNEITENLTVTNIFGEVQKIIDVKYDIDADFAIVELESAFEHSYAIEISPKNTSAGDATFTVGHPKDVAWGGVGWAVSFGHARGIEYDNYFNLFDIQTTNGFSGAGIYNREGQLVGIISGKTSAYSEGSNRVQQNHSSGFFQEDFEILDGPWKVLDTWQAVAVSHDFITVFMKAHNVINVPDTREVVLPENKPDRYFDSLTELEEANIKIVADSLRKSVVAFSVYPVSESSSPNGSGVLISDRIVATNSHVVEGKETFILTFYDGTQITDAAVLAHHPEMDVSLVLLKTPAPEGIAPVKIADARPVLGDKGFLIGHPSDLWRTKGGWQVSGARSGYFTDQIDDRGDILFEGFASGGMSGGPIFNLKSELVGINYAAGSSIAQTLEDYQDPHTTAYNPVVVPGVVNICGVDFFGVKDLIDQNSIYFPGQTYQLNAFETKYLSSDSGSFYRVNKSAGDQSVKVEEFTGNRYVEAATVNIPVNDAAGWSVVDCLHDNEGYLFVTAFSGNSATGVTVSRLSYDFECDTGFGTNGHFTSTLDVVKVIKAAVYDNKLYLLTQKSPGQQVSFSVESLDLSSPTNFQNVFNSGTEIITNSGYFPGDFVVNGDGFFIAGTTDDADDSISVFSRTFDHFVAHYHSDGSLNAEFGNNGLFQKDFGDTDKANRIALQPDGKLLLAGMNWLDAAPNAVVTRLNPDGTLDTGFGSGGTTKFVLYDQTDLGREEATDVFLDAEGNIYLAGTKYIGRTDVLGNLTASDGEYQSVVWKYDASGAKVEEFGTAGMATIPVSGTDKIQELHCINGQMLAAVAIRTENGTSNAIFSIDVLTGDADLMADDDFDDDGITDDDDNCVETYNPDQSDIDQNGFGDACDDNDNDGVINAYDHCPETSAGAPVDENGCEALYVIKGQIVYEQELKSSADNDLSGILVVLKEGSTVIDSAYTDSSGHYLFYVFNPGEYELEVNLDGYSQTAVISVVVDEDNASAEEVNFTIRENGTITGLREILSDNVILVYPNPSSSKLFLETDVAGEITIFDLTGNYSLKKKIEASKNEIDVSELTGGVYLLRFQSQEAVKTIQFVKN